MSGPNTVIQYSFSTGIVSPGVRNRRDWQKIDGAAADMLNGTVGPTGGSRKRPGLRFLNECLHDDMPVTLVKFEFSKTQTYLLEFGEYVMRFYINRELILDAGGGAYRIETPYSADEARNFTFAQERDAMFFAHWDKPLKRLTRYGHANWAWDDVFKESDRIASPSALQFHDAASDGHNDYEYAVTAYRIESGTPRESISYPTLHSDPAGVDFIPESPYQNIRSCIDWIKKYRAAHGHLAGFPTYPEVMDLSGVHNDHQTGAITKLTTIFKAKHPALGYIADGSRLASGGYSDRIYFWELSEPWQYGVPAEQRVIARYDYWYEGVNGGPLVPQASGIRNTWLLRDMAIDIINANYAVAGQTMAGIYNAVMAFTDSYNRAHSQKTGSRIKWPAVEGATGYYVYRRKSGMEDAKFHRIADVRDALDWNDANADETAPGTETPIERENSFVDPQRYPNIVTFYQQRMVLGCTKEKPTTIFGSRTGIYTDYTVNPSDNASGYEFKMASQTSNPLEAILPLYTLAALTSGGDFISTVSGAMNAANVNFNQKSYNGASAVPPLILGDSGLYVPLNQQTIQSMTYSYDKDGFAHRNILFHAQHLTKGRKVVGLAYQRDPINLVWGLLDDGTLISCLFIPDQDFLAWSRHETPGAVDFIATVPTSDGNDEIYMVVKRALGDGTVRQYLEVLEDMRPYGGTPAADTAFHVDCGVSGAFDPPWPENKPIPGLEHLEGREVAILADFSVEERQTVRNGSIALPRPVSAVHAGLPYEYRLKTIGFELLNQGTLRNTRSQAYRCFIEIADSRELLCAANGGEPGELIVHRADDFGNPALHSGDVKFTLKARDARRAFLEFSSPNPVPCEILSIVAEIDHGD